MKNELQASAQTNNLLWQPDQQLAWEQVKLPNKRETKYSLVKLNGQTALNANAQSSASMLKKDIRIEAHSLDR